MRCVTLSNRNLQEQPQRLIPITAP
uniref:Uncharacterized protein n=1 Tax=Anguilla anguilla TaxID=7936 RepID=A0A0E9QPM2_ANGAN